MSHRSSLLVAIIMAIVPAIPADARIRAMIGGQRFTAATKIPQSYNGSFFNINGQSRHGVERGAKGELRLACAPVTQQDTLPKTVECVSSSFAVVDAKDPNTVRAQWIDDFGTLHATVTTYRKLPHSRFRIRGTFSGSLDAYSNVSSPLEITDGHFGAILGAVGGGE